MWKVGKDIVSTYDGGADDTTGLKVHKTKTPSSFSIGEKPDRNGNTAYQG
ncbi:MAG: hypothetical protein M3162_07525 [Thermoproteota archaeon]|nr:hypothetical protein [Thermoproteota archaeon]